ncbi:hypothetical protein PAMC26510_14245 [Caballeronia sordidicola]|uniref:Uncharacterized protein n=1 Tax=Caballeronia sordidicola TaxID=196367 RepID=A0A242MHW7_CABSO|nr:hypothetical protein PAMC26577_26200 [Caballeronia sordidicola]OTP75599.1 hypothetical protein PAMC26510_14245 [Caballeronia sordidicola]
MKLKSGNTPSTKRCFENVRPARYDREIRATLESHRDRFLNDK